MHNAAAGVAADAGAAGGGGVNGSDNAPPKAPIWWKLFSVVLSVGFAVWFLVALSKHQAAQEFAAGILAVGLAMLTALGWSSYGAFDVFVGHDNRVSTSKTQAAMWTVALAWGIAFLLGRHLFENQALATVLPNDTWDQYLVVLGGPFAAAVLAKGVVTTQITNGTLTKTTATPDQTTIQQVLQNDAQRTDLVDSQYFLFNIVALVYFLVQIARHPVLPTLPSTLLAATSGAAALYVGNKAVSGNKPSISSVNPRSAYPGDALVIKGSQVLGGGSADQVRVELAGIGDLNVSPGATDTQVTATLAADTPTGPQHLFIVSGAGNSSDNYDIQVLADTPVIVGLKSPLVTPGEPVTIFGQGFASRLSDAVDVAVQFDNHAPEAGEVQKGVAANGLDQATVDAPAALAGPRTAITVVTATGIQSNPFWAVVNSP